MKLSAINKNIINRNNIFALASLTKAALKFGATTKHSAKQRLGYMVQLAKTNPTLTWVNERVANATLGIQLVGRKPTVDELENGSPALVALPDIEIDNEDFKAYVLENPSSFYQQCYWLAVKFRKYADNGEFEELIGTYDDMDRLIQSTFSADMQSVVENWHESKQKTPSPYGQVPEWLQDAVDELIEKTNSVSQFYAFFDALSPTHKEMLHAEAVDAHHRLILRIQKEQQEAMKQAEKLVDAIVDDAPVSTDNSFDDKLEGLLDA